MREDDDDGCIKWADMKSESMKELFASWVRSVIRKCFLTFLPVFLLIGGGFTSATVWYFNDMREVLKQNETSINRISVKIESVNERVGAMEYSTRRLTEKVFK